VLKEFVLKHNLTWPIIFDNQDATYNLCKKINIAQFPTYMLLDPSHKILFREVGAEGLEKIKKYMLSNKGNTSLHSLNK